MLHDLKTIKKQWVHKILAATRTQIKKFRNTVNILFSYERGFIGGNIQNDFFSVCTQPPTAGRKRLRRRDTEPDKLDEMMSEMRLAAEDRMKEEIELEEMEGPEEEVSATFSIGIFSHVNLFLVKSAFAK
jgi:hypothetical protein